MDSEENQKPMLILKDIHKFYGANEVLKGVSLEVRRGELVTFVGPSGCGKTTLLRLIGGFTDISSGDIILDGQRIKDLPLLANLLCRMRSLNDGFFLRFDIVL
ncbi:MAG: ATP-binding cassette domain-containing protein [Syntrophales bacterium]|nr:ATP-binding cassette domain-containing protein [Syntrophales bacterium]